MSPLFVDLGVIALDHMQLRHCDPRDKALFFGVGDDAVGHAELVRAVVVARLGNDIALHTEPLGGFIGERCGQVPEDLVVRARLPRRVNRRVKRVQVRVHVGRGHVVLFVPSCGREDEVRDQRGGGIAEVRGHHQIQLALRCLIHPLDAARAVFGG